MKVAIEKSGRPMAEPRNKELFLDLKQKEWYIYEENFGTSEEKFFVKFIDSVYDKLKKEYAEIFLLRNAKLFQLYNFSDGRACEPDFVLFLRKKRAKKHVVYQLFIEPKGQHLLSSEEEKWKEEFLMEIESQCQLNTLFENEEFKLVGMPFYNEARKKKGFRDKLEEVLSLRL